MSSKTSICLILILTFAGCLLSTAHLVFSAEGRRGAPLAPSNAVLGQITTNSMRLIWLDNSTDESCFKIERSEG